MNYSYKKRDITSKGKVALERALSKLGIASRTEAREWIVRGRVQVNGKVEKDPLTLVIPEKDRFLIDEKIVRAAKLRLVLLHKPKGYVTTKRDEKGRKTIYDLLPPDLQMLHSVGRLDMYTSGLLLMTTCTRLSSYLTDPNQEVERVYVVSVKGELTEEEREQCISGIEDEGELLQAKEIVLRKSCLKETHMLVTLVEGKNREIRRLFSRVGHEVLSLKRIRYGSWTLDDLPIGQWSEVLDYKMNSFTRNLLGFPGTTNY